MDDNDDHNAIIQPTNVWGHIKIHDHINNTIWWLAYIANQMQLQIWVLSVSTGLHISRFSPQTIFFFFFFGVLSVSDIASIDVSIKTVTN